MFSAATVSIKIPGPYKTRNGAQRHNGADVHRNLPKNYLKLCNNYNIGLGLALGLGIGLGYRRLATGNVQCVCSATYQIF